MAAKHTGRAFFTSALTTLGGFAVLMFSSLPLLADFGMVVTINIGVALLSALVVVPPLVKEADRRGLLAMGPERAHAHTGRRVGAGWIGGAVIAMLGIALVVVSVRDEKPVVAANLQTPTVEAPATIPPTTTTIPRSTTTALPPGVTLAPGETLPVDTLPPGPPERPTGLVAGVFYDTLVGVGADPGVARCAADDLIATTSEPDLIALGIAAVPRPAEVNALLDAAAKHCGVTQAQLDAAAASG